MSLDIDKVREIYIFQKSSRPYTYFCIVRGINPFIPCFEEFEVYNRDPVVQKPISLLLLHSLPFSAPTVHSSP